MVMMIAIGAVGGASLALVCKIPLLARRTWPSARATIGYLVYNIGAIDSIFLGRYDTFALPSI